MKPINTPSEAAVKMALFVGQQTLIAVLYIAHAHSRIYDFAYVIQAGAGAAFAFLSKTMATVNTPAPTVTAPAASDGAAGTFQGPVQSHD